MTAGIVGNLLWEHFGRLQVLARYSNTKLAKTRWFCQCECGKIYVARADHLTMGRVVSCGCYHAERIVSDKITHGHCAGRKRQSSEYNSWSGMKYRCSPDAPVSQTRYYYDMGVRVHPLWENDFQAFLDHIGPKPSLRHSIDRYPDPFGDYEPGNVRWATPRQQWENSRPEYLKRVMQDKERDALRTKAPEAIPEAPEINS